MRKGRLILGEGHDAQRYLHLDAHARLGHGRKAHSVQHGVILAQKGRALHRGQNACRLDIVRALPFGHGAAGAGAERGINAAIVMPGPLQCDLQLGPLLPAEQTLAGPGLARGLIQNFRLRRGDGGSLGCGGFGCCLCLWRCRLARLIQRQRGGAIGRCHCRRTFGQKIGADRPDLAREILAAGDIAVARDAPVAAQAAQDFICVISRIWPQRHDIPARSIQIEAVHILQFTAPAAQGLVDCGQVRLGLNLHPDKILHGGRLGGRLLRKGAGGVGQCNEPRRENCPYHRVRHP